MPTPSVETPRPSPPPMERHEILGDEMPPVKPNDEDKKDNDDNSSNDKPAILN